MKNRVEVRARWRDLLTVAAVAVVAGVVLFWGLGDRYLWQDEATIALLGERMLTHGKPLAYDGRNLITMDTFRREEFETGRVPTADAEAAVRFFAERGDYREDTTWIRHPWGSFLLAGLSLGALGHDTLAARLPFAACAVLVVVLLWWFVRKRFDDPWMATLAAALCLGNVYWLLHMRQCHYNAPSCLMMLATLAAYLRWQGGGRFGAAAFVTASWLWFQFDYGSPLPALAVLYADAARASWPNIRRVVLVGLAFAAATAPFVVYYDMLGRSTFGASATRLHLFLGGVFYLNQFLIPLLLLVPLGWLLWTRRRDLSSPHARILGIALATTATTILWLPWVTPATFYRYLVHLTPLAALVLAWTAVRLGQALSRGLHAPARSIAVALTLVLVVVPLPASLISWLFPLSFRGKIDTGTWVRPEWVRYLREMSGELPDPGGEVIRAVAARLDPGDEILVNYEDRPFMFYTGARVRGGIPAFRVNDPSSPPPRFFVFRSTVSFTQRVVRT